MKVISLFSGCGGLDLGFSNAGFQIVYANDNDKAVWETFEKNHGIKIDRRSICDIHHEEIPEADGIIGGPPCQSWSIAGNKKGIQDFRGRLFYEYIRILLGIKPKFFLAENVPGILTKPHFLEFKKILWALKQIGYNISWRVVNAADYGVPQERRRVIVVGYRKDINKTFTFPAPTHSRHGGILPNGLCLPKWKTIRDAIGDLPEPLSMREKGYANNDLIIPNHEYLIDDAFKYFRSNKYRNWDKPAFTIVSDFRGLLLHPNSTPPVKLPDGTWGFNIQNPKYRYLSVRECARIQTFPDSFIFYYKRLEDGYKMIGNAVPVKLAEALAKKIMADLNNDSQ